MLAGVITDVGEGVNGRSAGDAVVASLPMTASGAAAEYVAAPAEVPAAAPHTVEPADAAAPLFEHAGLKAGRTVLIKRGRRPP